MEDDDPIAQPLGFLDVVGDEHDGRAGVADPAHDLPGVAPADGVEVLGQFVEEHQPRSADEGEGDEQPLTFAAGEGVERSPEEPGELPLVGQFGGWSRIGVQRGEESQRLTDAHPSGQRGVLELGADAASQSVAVSSRVEPEHRHLAGVGDAESLEDLDGGRLARAVRPEQSEQLAFADGERHIVEHGRRPVAFGQATDLDHRATAGRRRNGLRRFVDRDHHPIVRRGARGDASGHGC